MAESNSNVHTKKGYMSFVNDFFAEIKKVIWPTPVATCRNTWITLVAIALVGTFVWVIDLGLKQLLCKVMELS